MDFRLSLGCPFIFPETLLVPIPTLHSLSGVQRAFREASVSPNERGEFDDIRVSCAQVNHGLWTERSGLEPWQGTSFGVIRQDTLLSQCFIPYRSMNEYQ